MYILAAMIPRHRLCVAILLLVSVAATWAERVPNPSFEFGDQLPVGWRVGSGDGDWLDIDGDRALVSRGTAEQTSFWRSEPVDLVPGGLYRLRFSARRLDGVGGGTVMSGTAFANRDLRQIDSTWQRFSSYFATPAVLGERNWLRFGQWHLPGSVAFDDLRLDRVTAVHRRIRQGMSLGQGERIADGRYVFRAPQRSALANHSRPLQSHQAGFNTYRWVFGAGEWVTYRHDIGGYRQTSAQVRLNVNYHTGGLLVVEARGDSSVPWTPVGTVDGARTAVFDLPEEVLPAVAVLIRLRAAGARPVGADADPGSFQIDEYTYEAALADGPPAAVGSTHLVAVAADPGRSFAAARIEATGRLQPGVADTLTIRLGQALREAESLRTRVAVTATGDLPDGAPWIRQEPTPSGELALPYRLTGTGDRVLHVELVAESGLRWHAELDVHTSILHADAYGELLAADGEVDVWWASSGWKVSTTRQAPANRGPALRIEAARNEAEAAQLILRPRRDLLDLTVRVTDLVGPADSRIDAGAIELLRVMTVPVRQPTDIAGEAADWPDPLLPLGAPLRAAAARNLALWVRVTTPRQIPAGTYRGTVHLGADGWSQDVGLHVEVYDFDLPDRMTCQTAFGFDPGAIWRYHRIVEEADRRTVLGRYLESFSRHHISPYDPAPLDRPVVDWPVLTAADSVAHAVIEPDVDWRAWDAAMTRAIDEYHFNSFRLAIPGMGGGTYIDRDEPELLGWPVDTPQYQGLFRGYGQAVQQHLEQNGWLDEAFVYWFDEPAPRDYDFVMDGFSRLRQAAPGITRMLTEQVEAALVGGPDLWCPVTPNFDVASAETRRAEGERFWWYVCTVPKAPWAGLFIDHAGTELRVWLWQTWQRDIDGILVWATNYWSSDAAYPASMQNPYVDPMSWQSANSAPAGTRRPWGNGDGRFLYPPRGAFAGDGPVLQGPVESMRWEMLRDGIEDYEYLAMLRRQLEEKADQLSAEELSSWSALLTVPDEISSSLTRFTEDPAPIEAHRRAVAQALERLSRL